MCVGFELQCGRSCALPRAPPLPAAELLLHPLALYLCWQLGYWAVTEVGLRSSLAADPDLITSLRYLAGDKKNGFRNLCLRLMRRLGVAEPDEELDPDTIKAKVAFFVCQLIYTLVTILPTPFLYSNYFLSSTYMVIIYSWGTWNGASYYIEVFAERYRLQFVSAGKEMSGEKVESGEESDEWENAMEEVEIDQTSELYESILAAIMEGSEGAVNKKDGEGAGSPKTEEEEVVYVIQFSNII